MNKALVTSSHRQGNSAESKPVSLLIGSPLLKEEVCEVAERVRKAVAAQPLAAAIVRDGIPTMVSLGVATLL